MSTAAPKVVALLGVTGSGKTIVVKRLLAAGFHRVRFGDPARDMLAAGFGCSVHEIDGNEREIAQRRFGGHSVQSVMHTLTHDWGRTSIHHHIWSFEWRRRVEALTGFVVTDDLKRPNEAETVRDVGGIIVRITRPGYVPMFEGAIEQQAKIKADIELINEGRDQLAAVTDQFLIGLDERLASMAA